MNELIQGAGSSAKRFVNLEDPMQEKSKAGSGLDKKVQGSKDQNNPNNPLQMRKASPCKQGDSCWEGYKAQGKKKSPSGKKTSGGSIKMVNNCVPITKKASGSPLKIAPLLGMIAKKVIIDKVSEKMK